MVDIKLLDDERDSCWERFFIKFCGLDYESYFYHEEILTKEILETHLDDIIDKIIGFIDYVFNPNLRPRSGEGDWILSMDDILIGLQILGLLILQTRSYLPDIVRRGVLYSTRWEYDKKREWSELLEDERKLHLKKFRNSIKYYSYEEE